jgi:hypothetical protein
MDVGPARHTASESQATGNGHGPSPPPDPLTRLADELEATVQRTDWVDHGHANGARPDGEPAPQQAGVQDEAQTLLEEAWSIFTECQVMRDGLLTACLEIEQTMDGIQRRLGELPVAFEPNGHRGSANGHLNGSRSH